MDPLVQLLRDAETHWREAAERLGTEQVGEFPVLWYGDVERWLSSDSPRVITAAVNPGPLSFDAAAAGDPPWHGAYEPGAGFDTYRSMLARFFETLGDRPSHRQWFDSYLPFLKGLGMPSWHEPPVLHTDIFSPIATSQVWSNLPAEHQEFLSDAGMDLWVRLTNILDPDLIVTSINRDQWGALSRRLGIMEPGTPLLRTNCSQSGQPYARGRVFTVEGYQGPGFEIARASKWFRTPMSPLDGARKLKAGRITRSWLDNTDDNPPLDERVDVVGDQTRVDPELSIEELVETIRDAVEELPELEAALPASPPRNSPWMLKNDRLVWRRRTMARDAEGRAIELGEEASATALRSFLEMASDADALEGWSYRIPGNHPRARREQAHFPARKGTHIRGLHLRLRGSA